MVGLPCLASQRATFHVGRMMWAVFTRVYLESCTWPWRFSRCIRERNSDCASNLCTKLGKSAKETLKVIQQGFGDQSLSRIEVFQWHTRFKTGPRQLTTTNTQGDTQVATLETVARIQELIRQDRRRTIRDIAEEVEVGYGTCQRVLTEELWMHRVAAKFVPSPTSFWRETKLPLSPTHRTPLIWHPVASSYFQKPNWSWKDAGLIPLRR